MNAWCLSDNWCHECLLWRGHRNESHRLSHIRHVVYIQRNKSPVMHNIQSLVQLRNHHSVPFCIVCLVQGDRLLLAWNQYRSNLHHHQCDLLCGHVFVRKDYWWPYGGRWIVYGIWDSEWGVDIHSTWIQTTSSRCLFLLLLQPYPRPLLPNQRNEARNWTTTNNISSFINQFIGELLAYLEKLHKFCIQVAHNKNIALKGWEL